MHILRSLGGEGHATLATSRQPWGGTTAGHAGLRGHCGDLAVDLLL